MKKMLRFFSLCVFALIMEIQYVQAQIVVYSNDFTSLDGFPPAGFAFLAGNTDFTPGSAASMQIGGIAGSSVLTSNQLAAWVSAAAIVGTTNKGFCLGSAPISAYIAPFNPVLNANVHTIGWNFNMRSSLPATGFATGDDNAGVIIACTDPDTRSAGNGYAVIFDPAAPNRVQLVSYTGGLTGVVTPIITSSVALGSGTDYASVSVTYDPALDSWSLYVRDDGSAGFADPGTGILLFAGTAVDATYTSATMTHFGFIGNYSVIYTGTGVDVQMAYFDNYTVTLFCGSIIGDANVCIGSSTLLTNPIPGGTWSSASPAIASINATTGWVTGVTDGDAEITYVAGSCTLTFTVTVLPIIGPSPITGSLDVCIGGTTSLTTVATVPPGTWASSPIAVGTVDAGGVVTGITTGTVRVSYVMPVGCNSTVVVTVNPDPGAITGTLTVCQGGTQTLNCTPAGGTWSSSTPANATINASTGVVTGLTAGTATIVYTSIPGCTTSTVITINPAPTAITATGGLIVCEGNTLALSSTPLGGTWSNSASGASTVNAATGVATGLAAGTTVITYTAVGCFRTGIITVNPAVTAITGTASTCIGRNTPLSNATAGGTWSSSNTAVGTISAVGQLTGLTAGVTTVVYTLSAGCSASLVVTVNTPPGAITGSAAVCLGATTTLNSSPAGGTWSSNNNPVASVNAGGVVTGVSIGTATISYISPDGCFAIRTVTVNSLPGAITGTAAVCVQQTTTLNASPFGGTWSSSNVVIATVNGSGVVGGMNNGTATITYTRLGCYSTATVTVNPLPSNFTPGAASSVCLGTTITLNSTPATGTWTASNANASVAPTTGVVTGNTTGTTVISYTIPTGCVRTRTITVNDLPAAIGGATAICPGSSTTLTNASTPGTWSSSNLPVATINAATGAMSGIASGNANITYTLNTGCIRTVVVTVSAAPTAAITPIGDTIMCPGDFVTLTSSTSPGVTYEWFNAGVLVPGASGSTLITSTAGSYQVRLSVAVGCSSLSVPMSVSVVPATATISVPGGSTSTCTGAPVVLNANTGVGLTYQWELGGAPISGATASTYSALLGGNYTVRVTNSAGCWAVSAPVAVVVNPTPVNVVSVSGPLAFCLGSSVTFTAATGVGYTYQWYNTAGPILGATGISYTATTADDFHVEVTGGPCTVTSATSTTVVNPLPNVAITPGGTRIFCAGNNVLLDATPGFTYQWYRDGAAIAGATNQAYLAMVGGGYRVEVTNPITGCSDMTHADTLVTVISSPAALPLTPAKFCWGGSSLLSTGVSGLGSALGYQWFFNGVPIPGATSPSYSAAATGGYHCRISVPGSCNVTTNAVTVTEMPLPDPPITFNGTMFSTSNFYVSYQWYKNLVPISGATAATTPATSDGNYKVAVTDTNGCQSVSAVYVLSGWKGGASTAVTDINSTDIRIYPNPAKETVHIQADFEVRAVISGIDGKVILNVENASDINLGGIADGIYLISLFDNQGKQIRIEKLVKGH